MLILKLLAVIYLVGVIAFYAVLVVLQILLNKQLTYKKSEMVKDIGVALIWPVILFDYIKSDYKRKNK